MMEPSSGLKRVGAGITMDDDQKMVWELWVAEPLNRDADVLVRWSKTSFFAGCPTSEPLMIDGVEHSLFQKCNEEWTVKYALTTAISNYGRVRLFKEGKEVSLGPFLNDVAKKSGKMLGDYDSRSRTGGMC